MITLAVDILGEQHIVAVLSGEQHEAPSLRLRPRQLSALYDEYLRLGRTLSEYEASRLIRIAEIVH
ncbi:MAG: hypothetical protein KUG83_08955 [Gammaproteobacteria bacterium]|nr:hypothetical protein [Gammaproteobacteria bacterium]